MRAEGGARRAGCACLVELLFVELLLNGDATAPPADPPARRPVLREAWRIALRAARDLIVTDATLSFVVAILLIPLLGAALRAYVAWSGDALLADQDLLRFVASPAGAIGLVVALALRIAVFFVQQAALLAIAHGAFRGGRVTTFEALSFAAGRGVGLSRLALRLVARLLLLVLPFLAAAGLAAWALLGEFDVNYYLKEKPREFWVAAGIGAALLFGLGTLLVSRLAAWCIALPLVLFERVPATQALRASAERTLGSRGAIAKWLGTWLGLTVIANVVVLDLVRWLGKWLLPLASGSMEAAVPAAGALLACWALAAFAVSTISSAALAAIVAAVHRALGGKGVEEVARQDVVWRHVFARRRLLVALALLVAGAGVASWLLLRDVRTVDDAVVIAHRGASAGAPENTLAALRLAIEERADWCEIDVQETRDGAVVVHHDADFMRVAGSPLQIWDATLAEVRELDVGRRIDARFAGERVPTLEEVLETARGRIRVLIELKHYGHAEKLEQRSIEIVERAGMVDQVAFMSLSWPSVAKLRELRPGWKAGVLAAKTYGSLDGLEADFVAVSRGNAKPAFLRAAAAAEKQVYVWTLNDRLAIADALGGGASGVITDRPGLAREVIERRAAMSSAERLVLRAALTLGLERDETPEQ